jgi:hypothetical protein
MQEASSARQKSVTRWTETVASRREGRKPPFRRRRIAGARPRHCPRPNRSPMCPKIPKNGRSVNYSWVELKDALSGVLRLSRL